MSTVSAIGRFPARKLVGVLISVSLIATALATWWSVRDLAAWLAVELAAASLGALLGFLIGLPGKAPGEAGNPEGSQTGGRQSEVQWHRISVFSDWIAGGAFALALSNGGTIGRVIGEVSAWTVAEDTNSLTGGERHNKWRLWPSRSRTLSRHSLLRGGRRRPTAINCWRERAPCREGSLTITREGFELGGDDQVLHADRLDPRGACVFALLVSVVAEVLGSGAKARHTYDGGLCVVRFTAGVGIC